MAEIDGQVIATVYSLARLVSWANTITDTSVVDTPQNIAQRYVQQTRRDLDGLLDDVPEGAALSGGMDMETSHGAAMLVVDAADVQPE